MLSEIRRVSSSFQEELRAAVEDPLEEADAVVRGARLQAETGSADRRLDPVGEVTDPDVRETDD